MKDRVSVHLAALEKIWSEKKESIMTTKVSVQESVLDHLRDAANRGFVTVLAPREATEWGCNILHKLPSVSYGKVHGALLRLLIDGRVSIKPDESRAGVLHLHYRYHPEDPESAQMHRKVFGAITA